MSEIFQQIILYYMETELRLVFQLKNCVFPKDLTQYLSGYNPTIEWTNFQMNDTTKPSLYMLTHIAECKLILMKILQIFNVEFWKYYFYLYLGINHICITSLYIK